MSNFVRLIRFVPAVLVCLLLAGLSASAQDAKKQSWWDAMRAFSQQAETPKFVAPALKPIAEKLPAVFGKNSPENVDDLKAIQEHVAKLYDDVSPAVVSVRVGQSFGSGVIVTKDGYILTAGHVSGVPNRDVTVFFHTGKSAKAKTLGGNHGIDSGLMKITSEAPKDGWPCADMGDCSILKKGDWCIVCAHPGGFKPGRTPPVRLGRLLNKTDSTLTTDCCLVGGDSGGPLFDMHGRVIGINSRIGQPLTSNMHVPVNPFRDSWEKLAKAEVFGGKLGGGGLAKGGPFLGLQTDPNGDGCIIKLVTPGSPADKAGLLANDIIRKFADKELKSAADLTKAMVGRKSGETIVLEITRGEEMIKLKVEIGKRP